MLAFGLLIIFFSVDVSGQGLIGCQKDRDTCGIGNDGSDFSVDTGKKDVGRNNGDSRGFRD